MVCPPNKEVSYLGSQPEVLSINPAFFDGLADLVLVSVSPSAIYMTVALCNSYRFRQQTTLENNILI